MGDDVVAAGLVPTISGTSKNYPYFKFGKVSGMPTETTDHRCGAGRPTKALKVWYIAINQVPGNSGSPVYAVPFGVAGAILGPSTKRPMLIGLQSVSIVSADLAGVTPASAIFEVIQTIAMEDADLYRGYRGPLEAKSVDKMPN